MFAFPSQTEQEVFSYTESGVAWQLSSFLLERIPFDNPNLAFCCIGTDRSTGDTLGPLVGTWLQDHMSFPFEVIGTLEHPLHALNLKDTADDLQNRAIPPFVIAIDACLGQLDRIGFILVENGPLFPGKAVKKELPPIGDLSIKGIVNVSGFMEYSVLQNTRLQVPYKMGKVIVRALLLAWQRNQLKLVGNRHHNSNNEYTWK